MPTKTFRVGGSIGKVERSGGRAATIDGRPTGYIAGGGYSGKTKELDSAVEKEAQALAKLFRRDVEIRFNSDRESGGAWIKDHVEDPYEHNAQVGLSAGLRPKYPNGMRGSDFNKQLESQGIDPFSWEGRRMRGALPKEIYYETGTSVDVLKVGAAEKYPVSDSAGGYWRYHDSYGSTHSDHLYVNHASISEARKWLRQNVDPELVKK